MKKEPIQIDPAELWIDRGSRRFVPGDQLTGQFDLSPWLDANLQAVELTVLWYTAGQGEEDFCVHHFKRHKLQGKSLLAEKNRSTEKSSSTEKEQADETAEDLALPTPLSKGSFETVLPISPVSYDGKIVKVCWTVRLRGFFPQGRERVVEAPFWLTVREPS